MTVKALALLTARPGMARADYVRHYEEVHRVLTCELMTGVVDYRRNHVVVDEAFGEAPPFSTVTEFWFRDRASFDATMGMMAEEEKARRLAADEENLFDRVKTRMFLVEEGGPDQSLDVVAVNSAVNGGEDLGACIRAYYAAYNGNDDTELGRFYAEDVVLVSPNGTIEGRDALLATRVRLKESFLDVMAIERLMVAGPVTFVEVRDVLTAHHDIADFYGRAVSKGGQVIYRIAGVYEWRDGKIVRITLHFI